MKLSNENWRKIASLPEKKSNDLNSLSKAELNDMLRRQEKMIANRKFMDSLPDKGKKIVHFKEKLQQAIVSKTSIEETTSFLSKLNLKETIDPKHPTLTIKKDESQTKSGAGKEYDLFAVAIADTYKPELADAIGDRFVLNKIVKKIDKEDDREDKNSESQLKYVKFFEDTALKPFPTRNAVKSLSVTESMQVGKTTKKKEDVVRLYHQLLLPNTTLKRDWRDIKVTENTESDSEMDEITNDEDIE